MWTVIAAAALLAATLGAATLIILSNVPGLLAVFPDETSLVRHVLTTQLDAAEAMAQGRMKKKVWPRAGRWQAACPR